MTTEMDKADCPFSGHGEELINVKFFRGRRDDVITAEEIHEQARSAVMQRKLGTATVSSVAPISAHPVIDVADFVNQL
jgi:hypothetical protein